MINITGISEGIANAIRLAVAGLPADSASFQVEPDQVYELANRFDAVADRIETGIRPEIRALMIIPPGADKPSVDAAERLRDTGFGPAGLVTRLEAYVLELRNAARGLRQTGQQYGLTDHTEGGRLGAASF